MKRSYIILLHITFTVVYLSCRKDPQVLKESQEISLLQKYLKIPQNPYNYARPNLPDFFKDQFISIQNNTPADNITTDWGATLGRVLFYDTRLSANNTVSCASCHQQQFGFSDTMQFSKGFHGGLTQRHSMGLINATFYSNGRFFWDERAASLEEQVLMPIQDTVEMGMSLDSVLVRLKATEYYPILFRYAFGKENINRELLSKALAQFVRSMISFRSKYDRGRAQASDPAEKFFNFTPEENRGKDIFMHNTSVNCFGCHNTDVFITDNARNNGLTITNTDIGVNIHTLAPQDVGKFKAPSIKNVALRHRYMHDGSISGLMAVVEHYNSSILPNPNLDVHLQNPATRTPALMNLTTQDLHALKVFLETLTDHEITSDPKFGSPF